MGAPLQRNKWYKHQLLMKYPSLRRFLPKSHKLSVKSLRSMLGRYNEVILKPVVGSGGIGIIKVSKLRDKKYNVHTLNATKTVTGKQLIPVLRKLKGKRPFLIQNCIPLAKVNDSLVDFRYIVQRKNGDRNWVITGKHGKIGKQGSIVTNLQQGANVSTVKEALQQSNIKDVKKTMSDLEYLSLTASKGFTREFKSQNIWGYDLGVDAKGRVWMIEANCTPLVGGFRYLKNKKMYKRIRKYQAYNRKHK
ncbi:hypothetical protein DVH26_08620 [Paenibacillus sp. H1-7]|nr:hypothetical protein DVH26_08620 [Paenibacillus sp. H1-7]